MTFARYYPGGTSDGQRLPAACINWHDYCISLAIDGDGGGNYYPTSPIVIYGDGLNVAGNGLTMSSNSSLAVSKTLTINGSLAVSATGAINVASSGSVNMASGSAISLASGATFGAVDRTGITCNSYTRTHIINAATPGYGSTNFTPIIGATNVHWEQQVNTVSVLYLPLCFVPLPATIIAITASVKGAAGHAALPAVMPKVEIVRQAADGSSMVSEGSFTDASASTGAYQTTHNILLTSLSIQPISYAWNIRFTGESGANALAGLEVYSMSIAWTSTSVGL